MSRTIYHFALAVSALCACSVAQAADPKTQSNTFAFVHAEVVPMDRQRVLSDQTVVVTDGKITALGPSSKLKVPSQAFRIDARGRYLLPALSDMHVHVEGESWNALLTP